MQAHVCNHIKMKNLIYISLVAIIVLSGCKGNSYLTQRYTKFGHSHNKNSAGGPTVRKVDKVQVINTEKALEANSANEEPISCSNSASIKESLVKPTQRLLIKSENEKSVESSQTSLTKVETVNTDNKKTELKSKKSFKEKTESAKRIIGTLFKIVLYIIILAVVVGIIILVVIL